jgi:hypothetical protein
MRRAMPTARAFLVSWLPTYPRKGSLYSHLNWHLALGPFRRLADQFGELRFTQADSAVASARRLPDGDRVLS